MRIGTGISHQNMVSAWYHQEGKYARGAYALAVALDLAWQPTLLEASKRCRGIPHSSGVLVPRNQQ